MSHTNKNPDLPRQADIVKYLAMYAGQTLSDEQKMTLTRIFTSFQRNARPNTTQE